MGLDIQKLTSAKFHTRTEAVRVPALRPFFPDGDAPVWTVRMAESHEIAAAAQAVALNRSDAFRSALSKIQAGDAGGQAAGFLDGYRTATGELDKKPDDYIRRLNLLAICSVDPEIEITDAVVLARRFPQEFHDLTNTILRLTGQGAEIEGESNASGGTDG